MCGRRKNRSNILEVAMFLEEQLQTSSQYNGYRRMHLRKSLNMLQFLSFLQSIYYVTLWKKSLEPALKDLAAVIPT